MRSLLVAPVRHPAVMLITATIVSLISIVAARHIHNDASIDRLFPSNDPAASALTHIMNNYAAVEQVLVMASLPEGASGTTPDSTSLTIFAQRLADGIHQSASNDLVAEVHWKTDDRTRQFFQNVMAPNGIYYLDDAEMAAAQQRLSHDGIAEQIHHDEDVIATPGPVAGALSKVLLQDPLNLHEFLMNKLGAVGNPSPGDADFSADGRSLLIQISGTKPISDLAYCHAITDLVNEQAAAANRDGLRLDISGGYAIAAASETGIRHDMIGSVTGSITLMGLLFLLAYRRPVALFIAAMIPVGLGILWGFGIYGAAGLQLTPLTAVVGAILAGMGIDYSVQFLSRY
jgi:predicted exporter